jgi:hypothetical protein
MTSNDFCNWLKGYLELTEQEEITAKQAECIQKHLAMVFKYEIDPSYGDEKMQEVLDQLHNPEDYWDGDGQSGGMPGMIRC